MTNEKLNKLINEFIESQPTDDKDEWYTTSQGIARTVMSWFTSYCKEKGIDIAQISVKEE